MPSKFNIDINAIKLMVQRQPGMYLRDIASALNGLKPRERRGGKTSYTFRSGWKEIALKLILNCPDLVVCCDRFEASSKVRNQFMEMNPDTDEYREAQDRTTAATPIRVYLASHVHWSRPLPLPESALQPSDVVRAVHAHCTTQKDPTVATWTPEQKVRSPIEDLSTTQLYRNTDMPHRKEDEIKAEITDLLVEWELKGRQFSFTDVIKKIGINTKWFESRPHIRREIEEASLKSKGIETVKEPSDALPKNVSASEAIASDQPLADPISFPVPPAPTPDLVAEVERLRRQVEELQQPVVKPMQETTVMNDRDIVVAALRRREQAIIGQLEDLEQQRDQIDRKIRETIAHLHGIQIALKCERKVLEPEIRIVMSPVQNGSWVVNDRLEALS
jgi:hypothetical protein